MNTNINDNKNHAFDEYLDFPHPQHHAGPGKNWFDYIRSRNLRGSHVQGDAAVTMLFGDAYIPSNQVVDDGFFGPCVPNPIKRDEVALTEYITRMRFDAMIPPGGFTPALAAALRRQCATQFPNQQQTVEWIAEFWMKTLPQNAGQINYDRMFERDRLRQQQDEQERRNAPSIFERGPDRSAPAHSSAAAAAPRHNNTTNVASSHVNNNSNSNVSNNNNATRFDGDSFVSGLMQSTLDHLAASDYDPYDEDEEMDEENHDDDQEDLDRNGYDRHGRDDDEEDRAIEQMQQWFDDPNDLINFDHGLDDEDQQQGAAQQQQQQPAAAQSTAPLLIDTGLRVPLERAIGAAPRDADDDDAAAGGAVPVVVANGRVGTHCSIHNYLWRNNRFAPCEALEKMTYIEYVSFDCAPLPGDVRDLLRSLLTLADATAAAENATAAFNHAKDPTSPLPVAVAPNYNFMATNPVLAPLFLFDIEHPLFATHHQRRRRNIVVPKIAGTMMRGISAAAPSVARRDAFAEYIGILFCPFSGTSPPAVRNWVQLERWIQQLDIVNNLRHRSYLAYIHQMSSLYVPHEMQQLLALWRLKNATNKFKNDVNPTPRVVDPQNLNPQAIFNHDKEKPDQAAILEHERARQVAEVTADRRQTTTDIRFANGARELDLFFAAVDAWQQQQQGQQQHQQLPPQQQQQHQREFFNRQQISRVAPQCEAALADFVQLAADAVKRAAEQPQVAQQQQQQQPQQQPPNHFDRARNEGADRLLDTLRIDLAKRIASLTTEQTAIFEIVKRAVEQRNMPGVEPQRLCLHLLTRYSPASGRMSQMQCWNNFSPPPGPDTGAQYHSEVISGTPRIRTHCVKWHLE